MRVTASCVVVLLLYHSIGKGLTECDKCTGESCEKDCSNSSEAKGITCSSINLPTNHCDIIDNQQKVCVDNQPYIGTNIDPLPYWIKCCYSSVCPYRTTGKPAGHARKLSQTWIAVDSKIATLKLQWLAPFSATGYQLVIAALDDSHVSPFDRCMCLPATLDVFTYFVNVSLSAGTSLDVKLIGYPYPPTIFGRNVTTNNLTVPIPSSCWDTTEASYSKCGPMLPSAPRNLTVVDTPVSEMMNISWEPPKWYNPNITAYKIEINDATFIIGARRYCGICNDNLSYGQATCQYNVTPPSVAHEYVIRASASSCKLNNSVDVIEQDCEDISDIDIAVNDTLCWGKSTVVIKISTVPASAADNSQPQITLIVVISSLSILVSLMVVIIIILIITHTQLRRAAANRYISLVVDGDGYAAERVFVINSPQSSEDDRLLVRRLCHELADNSVKPVNYQYSEFDRQHGPGQSGIYQWAEKNFTECNMILFVCNKSFYDAWNNGDTNQNSLISASKFLLQGHLSSNRSEDVSKFGVVLLRQTDDQYVPSLLRSLQKYVMFQDGQCVIESLLNQII